MNKNKILISVIFFTCLIIILIIALNPSHKYKSLSINESKWNSIQQSRVENNNLILEDIKFNEYKLVIDEKNDTIYYSVVNDSKNKYNPNVSYRTNSKKAKLVILLDEITDEKIKNNYRFKIMIYNEKEYHVYSLKCTNLPILNISYNQADEINEKNIQMKMYLFDNVSDIPNKMTISSGKIRMKEDNYLFLLHMLTPGKNKRENELSILSMEPNSEYTLTPANNELENEIDRSHRVQLFLNSEYKGVYFLRYVSEKNFSKF